MGNLNNLVFFGEGVSVAGCLILHMLGQRHRFRLFDFCAHVCSVAETSDSAPTDPTMQVQEASELALEGGRSPLVTWRTMHSTPLSATLA